MTREEAASEEYGEGHSSFSIMINILETLKQVSLCQVQRFSISMSEWVSSSTTFFFVIRCKIYIYIYLLLCLTVYVLCPLCIWRWFLVQEWLLYYIEIKRMEKKGMFCVLFIYQVNSICNHEDSTLGKVTFGGVLLGQVEWVWTDLKEIQGHWLTLVLSFVHNNEGVEE